MAFFFKQHRPNRASARSGFRAGRWGLLALAAVLAGCGSERTQSARKPQFPGVVVEVAALGDTSILEAIRAQVGEWESETGARVSIHPEPIPSAAAADFDLVVFPGQELGALVDQGALAIIPESAVRPGGMIPLEADDTEFGDPEDDSDPALRAPQRDTIDFGDVVQALREQAGKYGEDRMAVPIGGSALVLVYRRDAFGSESNRQAAAAENLTLEPPKTWEQLDSLARFFENRDWKGDGKTGHGLAAPLGADAEGLGLAIAMARVAALGLPPDQFALFFDADGRALDPRIDSAPFVEAFEAIAAWRVFGPPEMADWDASAAREAFRAGRAAMLIDLAERASQWTDPSAPAAVGVAALPGSSRVFDPVRKIWLTPALPNRVSYLPQGGGWLLGLGSTSTAQEREAAIHFLRALASPETAQAIISDPAFPMLPVRQSHFALGLPDPRAALGVDSRAWGQALSDLYNAPRVVIGLRILEADDYLTDLEAARVKVMQGADAQATLSEAAAAWARRTEKLGAARQRWHYRRSLNRLSTESRPPAAPAAEAP